MYNSTVHAESLCMLYGDRPKRLFSVTVVTETGDETIFLGGFGRNTVTEAKFRSVSNGVLCSARYYVHMPVVRKKLPGCYLLSSQILKLVEVVTKRILNVRARFPRSASVQASVPRA